MAKPLTPKQKAAIAALLVAKNQAQAASIAGVKMRTLSRWLTLPEFREELTKAESEAINEAARRLTGLASKAIENLEMMLSDPVLPAQQRIYVSKILLDGLLKVRELAVLEERISRLEEVINGKQSAG